MWKRLQKRGNIFPENLWGSIVLLTCLLGPLIVIAQSSQNKILIKGRINQYDSERYNLLTNQLKFDLLN